MSHARGQVKFSDSIKHFEFNGTEGICRPKLYDTYDEMIDNWREYDVSIGVNDITYDKKSWLKKIFKTHKGENRKQYMCNHNEESVEIYIDYSSGSYWKGTACRKCNMILKGKEPFELPVGDGYIDGIPEWAEDYNKYYDD